MICQQCGKSIEIPLHCKKEMIEHNGKLVCWMNVIGFKSFDCGSQEIPKCTKCGVLMKIV